jgi:APA family basic amino acid/polyamine antiporter
MNPSRKIGFWSVFALVTGSQIGAGIFMLPATLAPYGLLSLGSWALAGCGALALALVFSWLCAQFPQTGGPHVYVNHAFGATASFFTGWTYWVISWVSTTAVIVACIGYLAPLIGKQTSSNALVLELVLLSLVTLLNLKGVKTAGRTEFILVLLKIIPLIIIPCIGLWFFKISNFTLGHNFLAVPHSQLLGQATLLAMWGFIGLESATTPADEVDNPTKTIPRALFWGTLCVGLIYLLNCVGIMGLIPGDLLAQSQAPYVDATQILFGGNWHVLIALVASLICISNLNAWTLTSGQIALGLAHDSFLPACFAIKNNNAAPVWGLLTSSCGVVALLVLTTQENFAQQITAIIYYSVTAFLCVYTLCTLGFLWLLRQRKKSAPIYQWIIGIFALVFCGWVLYKTPLSTLGIASLFTLSGVPVYLWKRYGK